VERGISIHLSLCFLLPHWKRFSFSVSQYTSDMCLNACTIIQGYSLSLAPYKNLCIWLYFVFYRVNLEDTYYPCKGNITVENEKKCKDVKPPLIDVDRNWCIYIFAIITFGMIIVTLIRSMTFVKMCITISLNLHNAMFEGITRATMYFFNTNPSGRISFMELLCGLI